MNIEVTPELLADLKNNDWKLQDDYREADCCENCIHGRAWSANVITCRLHGEDVADTMVCNSFEKKGDWQCP